MQNVIACSDEHVPTITCPQHTIIHVLYASFGRTQLSSNVCPYVTTHNDDTGCYSNDGKLAAVCEGKQTCTIVPSGLGLGDPCAGTYKYTEVRYICQPTGIMLTQILTLIVL